MTLRRPAGLDALAWNADGLVPVVVQEVASGAVLMLAWADREALARTLDRGEGWFWSRSRRRLWRKGETSGHALAVAEVAVDCDGDTLLYRVDATGPTCHTGARSCFEEEAGAATAGSPAEGRDAGRRIAEGGGGPAAEAGSPVGAGAAERLDEEGGGSGAGAISRVVAGGAMERFDEEGGGRAGGGAIRAPSPALAGPRLELGWLWEVLAERAAADPAASYTARLLAAGVDRIARKVGEEATEVVIAALRAVPAARTPADSPVVPLAGGVPVTTRATGAGERDAASAAAAAEPAPSAASPLAAEAADLLYHLLVLLLAAGVPPEEVAAELRRRHARPSTPASPKPEGAPAPTAGPRRAPAPPPEDPR